MFEGMLVDDRLWNGVEKLLKTKQYYIKEGKIVERPGLFSFSPESPWVFIRGIDCRQCAKWFLYHNYWGFVPEYCWNRCWKVVIRVDTLEELLGLHGFARALNFPGKVGINMRDYVKGPYLGFFYSENEVDCLNQKNAFMENGFDKDIIHKQRCTEFTATGAQPNPELESALEKIMGDFPAKCEHPAWLNSMIMWKWNRFANKIGDPTAIDRTVKCGTEEQGS